MPHLVTTSLCCRDDSGHRTRPIKEVLGQSSLAECNQSCKKQSSSTESIKVALAHKNSRSTPTPDPPTSRTPV